MLRHYLPLGSGAVGVDVVICHVPPARVIYLDSNSLSFACCRIRIHSKTLAEDNMVSITQVMHVIEFLMD